MILPILNLRDECINQHDQGGSIQNLNTGGGEVGAFTNKGAKNRPIQSKAEAIDRGLES